MKNYRDSKFSWFIVHVVKLNMKIRLYSCFSIASVFCREVWCDFNAVPQLWRRATPSHNLLQRDGWAMTPSQGTDWFAISTRIEHYGTSMSLIGSYSCKNLLSFEHTAGSAYCISGSIQLCFNIYTMVFEKSGGECNEEKIFTMA